MVEPVEWRVIIHRRAEKVLTKLPNLIILVRVRETIRELKNNPRPQNCKKLIGFNNLYRIRIGNWRIIYAIEEDQLVILVVEIAPRGEAYQNIKE